MLDEHGLGREKNPADAYEWYSLAAASQDLSAIKRRDLIKAKAEPAERAVIDSTVQSLDAKPA